MAASSQGAAAVPLRPPLPSGNGSDAGVAAEAGNPKMDVERFRHRVDEYICKADELEQKVNEVVEYYANRKQPNNSKGNSGGKDKDKRNLVIVEATIVITQHKWARPFMNPVDVKGLGLDDYYEEARQKDEEAQALANMQIAREAGYAKIARDTNSELDELNVHLEELRKLVIQKCRKMSAEEKRKLGVGLSALSPDDLNKALEIFAEDNPNFQTTGDVVDVDMDAQSEITLWKVKFFVKGALELQAKNCASKADDNLKRKKEICDALAKTARKRNKKLSSL
ncbi:BROMO [Musa troglodytarum]|uniref:BROMO n=1 Tax=Musa troglodytarum TaxID=320322 RepID=A0A9E7KZM7_9LILI|nr:BROMO [Musa troglodytarum]